MSMTNSGAPPDGKWYKKLLNEGPQPGNRGRLTPEMRSDGVTVFNPQMGTHTTGVGHGGTTPVLYIEGRHDVERVVRVWAEANETALEKVGERNVYYAIARAATKEVARAVIGTDWASGHGGAQNGPYGGTCPFCGEEYGHSLAKHLPCTGTDKGDYQDT